jgi:plasmid stabilization system protein ParE
MRYRIVMRPAARLDLHEAADWIAERSPGGAERWFHGFLAALKSLEADADQWGLAPEAEYLSIPVRQWFYRTKSSVTRVVFTIVGDEVHVLRVRRPGQDLLRKEDLP